MKRKIVLDENQAALLSACVDRQITEDLRLKELFETECESAISVQDADEASYARDRFAHRIIRLQALRELIG